MKKPPGGTKRCECEWREHSTAGLLSCNGSWFRDGARERWFACLDARLEANAWNQMAEEDHVEPYLRSVFGFIGVKGLKFLTAGGASALRQGKDRNEFLAPHIQAFQTYVAQAQ